MHDDLDYVRAGIAYVILIGVIFVKIIMLIKPSAHLDYEKLSLIDDNYHQELILDEQKNRRSD